MSLSKTTYAQGKYVFDSLEVKKIDYLLKDRELLLKDTADYKLQIVNLKQESFSLRLAIESVDSAFRTKDYENMILRSDFQSLNVYSEELSKQNKKLKRKLTIGKYVVPISFGLGVFTTILILK